MRNLRFNIATLLLIVLVVAVGVAALRESNEIWDSVLFTVTLGVLLVSILLAIHRTEKRRAFWVGFGLFGAAYLGLSLVPSIESRLATTKGLGYVDSKVFRSTYDKDGDIDLYVANLYVVNNSQPIALNLNKGNGTFQDVTTISGLNVTHNQGAVPLTLGRSGTTEHRIRIGHALFALLAGWLGGVLSRRLGQVPGAPEVSAEEGTGSEDVRGPAWTRRFQ